MILLVSALFASAAVATPSATPAAARAVVQRYYAAIDRRDYRTAYRLWDRGGQASRQSYAQFVRGFADTRHTRIITGAPTRPEGAAGSTYIRVPVTVRAEDGTTAELLRVVAAGVLARSHVTVSTPAPLPPATAGLLHAHGVACRVEDTDAWRNTLRGNAPARVRLLGGTRQDFAAASDGRVDVALYAQPVVEAGRIEMLTFLREQSVSVTAHRFGSPTALTEGLFD